MSARSCVRRTEKRNLVVRERQSFTTPCAGERCTGSWFSTNRIWWVTARCGPLAQPPVQQHPQGPGPSSASEGYVFDHTSTWDEPPLLSGCTLQPSRRAQLLIGVCALLHRVVVWTGSDNLFLSSQVFQKFSETTE